MPRGKKELAIPKLREIEVELGRGKTVANGGQEDRCDGPFDTLHEAKVLFRAVAAALQHDRSTQCLGIPAPGASKRGWSIGGQNLNLRK